MNNKNLHGKIVWITGGSRGIGREMAQTFSNANARVVICARDSEELSAAAQAIGENVLSLPCDVRQNDRITSLVEQVKRTWGSIDILINNAGIGIFQKIIDTSEQEWEDMMNVNLKSAFMCVKAVLPAMIERGSGHIINVVSVAGRQPYYNCGGYCASKYGLLGFTDVLRLETRKHGIQVTALMPGATDTEIWGRANVDRSRMMNPARVAEAVLALCCNSPQAMIEELVLRPQGGDL